MDGAFDVPDSTDWLETSLKDFAALENSLHCQICKEFYDTPMITSCNHTFCSRCIRTSLSADGKCPACRAADQASKLRNNWAIQEVTATFLVARPKALEVARKPQQEPEPPKRLGKRKRPTLVNQEGDLEAESLGRTTRSKSRRVAASQGSQPETIEIEDSEDGEDQDFQPEPVPEPEQPKDGRVHCPLGCGKRMKEGEVFDHLDKCEEEQKQATGAKSRIPLNGFIVSRPSSSSQSQGARPQDRINELNYGMLKDGALSKKLKDQGLPNFGSKQLMINRHKEWVNIWNANCDSNDPRSRRDLLRDLEVWERTQGGRAPQGNGLTGSVMRKDYDGAAHAKRHQDEFSRLIADARRMKNIPATETSSAKDDTTNVAIPTDNGKSTYFSEDPPVLTEDEQSNKYDLQESRTTPVDPKPYEHDPEALANVREKVEAVNQGRKIEPPMNEGFRVRRPSDAPGAAPASHFLSASASASPGGSLPSSSQQNLETPSMFRSIIDLPKRASTSRQTAISPATPISLDTTMPDLTRSESKDEHGVHESTGSLCDVSAQIYANSPKKVPMFAVPAQPVTDVDGGGGATASHE